MVIREKPLIFGHTQPKALPMRTVPIMQWSSMGLSSVLNRTHISVEGFFPQLRFAIRSRSTAISTAPITLLQDAILSSFDLARAVTPQPIQVVPHAANRQ